MGQVSDVKLHHKSMRTSRIDRCEPRYAGTEFTNRDVGCDTTNYQSACCGEIVGLYGVTAKIVTNFLFLFSHGNIRYNSTKGML